MAGEFPDLSWPQLRNDLAWKKWPLRSWIRLESSWASARTPWVNQSCWTTMPIFKADIAGGALKVYEARIIAGLLLEKRSPD